MTHIVTNVNDNERIDNYLINVLNKSRSKIQNLIKNGNIRVNNKNIKSSYILKQGDIVDIDEIKEEQISAKPEKIDLDIVYEDDEIGRASCRERV